MQCCFQQARSCPAVQSNIQDIERSIDFLLTQQFSAGNFHSSLENHSDRLVHWCHGAPGAVHLMLKAHKVIWFLHQVKLAFCTAANISLLASFH